MPNNRKFILDLDKPDYLLALGQFVAQFALVEFILTHVVRYFSKLSDERQIARAVLGAMRVDAACTMLTRLMEARSLRGRDIDELRLIITQLGLIAKTRNDIVHRGATGYGRLVVTNRDFAHARNRVQIQVVNAKILGQMQDDLSDIFIALTIISKDTVGESPATVRREVGYLSKASWRYKPRVRNLRPRKTRKRPLKP